VTAAGIFSKSDCFHSGSNHKLQILTTKTIWELARACDQELGLPSGEAGSAPLPAGVTSAKLASRLGLFHEVLVQKSQPEALGLSTLPLPC
jgi:hypothetical protein